MRRDVKEALIVRGGLDEVRVVAVAMVVQWKELVWRSNSCVSCTEHCNILVRWLIF